jgi:hypothetical protein
LDNFMAVAVAEQHRAVVVWLELAAAATTLT